MTTAVSPILARRTLLLAASWSYGRSAPVSQWPLWESYCARFLESSGRIVDHDADGRTTSEGQSYALFLALVANDRERFQRILAWTQTHLAAGSLYGRLPAWHWGRDESGSWRVLDNNSASDADLWIAYTLVEAGRLWQRSELADLGLSLLNRIEQEEVVDVRGLGPTLLPGWRGFRLPGGAVKLNASYLPTPVLIRLMQEHPEGPWAEIAISVPKILRGSAPKGYPLDWIQYDPARGFQPVAHPSAPASSSASAASPGAVAETKPLAPASYDAIRTYLWAGMLHPDTPQRLEIQDALTPMLRHVEREQTVPSVIEADGKVRVAGSGPGFAAALLPLLHTKRSVALAGQRRRLQSSFDSGSGLYGKPARYYDQNLALFALGFLENRYQFSAQGRLLVSWLPESR